VDLVSHLALGFGVALTPINLMYAFIGALVGTLIVGVLRNGLTQAGVDNLYQNIATGVLVILAVALDQFARRRN